MKKIGIMAIILGSIFVVIDLIGMVVQKFYFGVPDAFVTVIGGADGPTSVFLAGKLGGGFEAYLVIGILLIVIGNLILGILRKQKKDK